MFVKNYRKMLITFISLIFVFTPLIYAGTTSFDMVISAGTPQIGSGDYTTTGDVYFVDSNATAGADSADKGAYDQPFITVDYAIGRCTANNGDIIFVAPGHAETFTAANGFDADVAGVRIVGLGSGTDRPTFTFTATAATIAIGAANVTVENINLITGIAAVVIGIAVEAAGDHFKLINCAFPEPVSYTTYNFLDAIDLAAGADFVTIESNEYYHMNSIGPAHFIEAGNGVNNGLTITNNLIMGEFSVSAIWSNDADLETYISGNTITNATNGQHAIEFTAAATGSIDNTLLRTDAVGTALDPGSMTIGSNVTWDADATADSVAAQPITGSTGTGTLGGVNDTTTDSINGKIGTDTEMADSSIYDMLNAGRIGTISDVVTGFTNGTAGLFTVAGGPIKIIEIVGYVTDTIGSEGNLVNYNINPTAPAADTVFGTDGTALETNADAIGTLYTWDGVVANDLTATTNGAALGVAAYSGIIVPIGAIELATANDGTVSGEITVYMRYLALDSDVTVTVTP